MHELSIAISLLETAEEEARRQGGGEVLALHLRIGPLSGVVSEAACVGVRDGAGILVHAAMQARD